MDSYVMCILSTLISLFLAVLYDPPPLFARAFAYMQQRSLHPSSGRTATSSGLDVTNTESTPRRGSNVDHCHCDTILEGIGINDGSEWLELIQSIALNSLRDVIPNEGIALRDFVLLISFRVMVAITGMNVERTPDIEGVRDIAADFYRQYIDNGGRTPPCVHARANPLQKITIGSAAVASITTRTLSRLEAEPRARLVFEAFQDRPTRRQYRTTVGRFRSVESIIFDILKPPFGVTPFPQPRRSWTIPHCIDNIRSISSSDPDIEAARESEHHLTGYRHHFRHNSEPLGLIAAIVTSIVMRDAVVELCEDREMVRRRV